MELVSVIVPIYNADQYLDRCVASIVGQCYSDLEILLIDDGSSDESPSKCEKWASLDERIKVIHQKNSGVSAARNAGLRSASGKYVLMVDSDDYLSVEMISSLYAVLTAENADLALCDFEKGTEESHVFTACDTIQAELISSEEALLRIYNDSNSALRYVAPWGKLYKRELFEGIQYPEGKIFEDIYVTHQLLYRCNHIAVIHEPLVYYFQHSDSIMNEKFHVGKLDYLEALKERIVFFRDRHLDELSELAYDEYLHSLIWEYSRARDVIQNRSAMKDIVERFRAVYRKGYSSKRYPAESSHYLAAFNCNPELIVAYWKINAKRKKIFHR